MVVVGEASVLHLHTHTNTCFVAQVSWFCNAFLCQAPFFHTRDIRIGVSLHTVIHPLCARCGDVTPVLSGIGEIPVTSRGPVRHREAHGVL